MFSVKKLAILAPLLSASLTIIYLWIPIGFTALKAQETPTSWFEPTLPAKNDYNVRTCNFVQSANYQVTLWQCLLRPNTKPANAEGNPNEILWIIPIATTGHWQTPEIFDPLDNSTVTSKRLIGEILAVNQYGEWLVRPPATPPAATVNYNNLRLIQPLINNSPKYSVQELSQHFTHAKWAKNINNDQWLVWDDWGNVGQPQSPKSDIQIMALTRQGKKVWMKSTSLQNPLGVTSSSGGSTFIWSLGTIKNDQSTTNYFCEMDQAKGIHGTIDFPADQVRIALPLKNDDSVLLLASGETKIGFQLFGWIIDIKAGCTVKKILQLPIPNHQDNELSYSWLEDAIVTDQNEVIIFYGQQWDVRYIDFERQPERAELRADLWALKINPDKSKDIIWDKQIISRTDPVSEAFSISLWDEAAWQKIGLKNWGLSLAYLPAINQILLHPQKPINIPNNTAFPKNPRIYKVETK